jgi:hypothetical protein
MREGVTDPADLSSAGPRRPHTPHTRGNASPAAFGRRLASGPFSARSRRYELGSRRYELGVDALLSASAPTGRLWLSSMAAVQIDASSSLIAP